MLASMVVGKMLTGGLEIGGGFLGAAARVGTSGLTMLGAGIANAGRPVARGLWNASTKIGESIISPVSTREKTGNTASNWLQTFADIGNTMVHKNAEGNMRLTSRGLLTIGGITMGSKAYGSWFDAKSANLGAVDQQPVRPTPNYNPQEYEMHPAKRVSYDSGGATGDLVFALHRNR